MFQQSRIAALLRLLSPRSVRQLAVTLALMLVGAFAEMLTIGAVLPFLALVAWPDKALPGPMLDLLGLVSDEPLIAASSILIGAAITAAIVRLALTSMIQRTVRGLGHDMAVTIFGRMLRQPYEAYLRRHSSETLSGIEKVQGVIFGFLQPIMLAAACAVMAMCIAAFLFAIDPFATSVAAAFLIGAYAALGLLARKRLAMNSITLADAGKARTRLVQEALGSIRDILLDRAQPLFEERFRLIDADYRRAHAANSLIAAAPRFVVEATGIVALALVTVAASLRPGGVAEAIPVLGALALGAQRLLPLLQQSYSGWTLASGNFRLLVDVVDLMEARQAPVGTAPAAALRFEDELALESVSFRYRDGTRALHDVSLAIRRGTRVGISGPTGSGKSTLIDILMGLLEPCSGHVRIDGRILDPRTVAAWQARIAHVPQSLALVDDTIAANIAFGVPLDEIDRERLLAAASAARVDEYVARMPDGFETMVGERGVRLSGGQRQRLGIARALYKGASVLFLDEATSALDDETEAAVLRAIMAMDDRITIVIVAHRLSTLAKCETVIRLEAGEIGKELARTA